MPDEKEHTSIIPKMAELGKAILKKALEDQEGQQRDRVVAAAKAIIDERDRANRMIAGATRQVALCEGRLAAFDAGKFHVEQYTMRVIFDDADLNIDARRDAHGNLVWDY